MKKKTTLDFELLSIEGDGYHLLVNVLLNGIPGAMLLDTGASRTIFDQQRILRFIPEAVMIPADKTSTGLGTDSMLSHYATLDSFEIGNLKLEHLEIVLLDLVHVNQSYEKIGLMAIDGVLGSDLLAAYDAVINYKKQTLRLSY
jgi:hypothetical protein